MDLNHVILTRGAHVSPGEGLCALELTAYLAGEPHSDHPACACPVLSAFVRRLNDAAWPSDETRTAALVPVARALVGSADPEKMVQRALALTNWGIRVCRLGHARANGWTDLAVVIERLAPIVDRSTALAARDQLRDYVDRSRARHPSVPYAAVRPEIACAFVASSDVADVADSYVASAARAAYAVADDKHLTDGARLVLSLLR